MFRIELRRSSEVESPASCRPVCRRWRNVVCGKHPLSEHAALWPERLDDVADAIEVFVGTCWRVGRDRGLRGHCAQGRKSPESKVLKSLEFRAFVVGLTGFEPATFCSQSRRATKLRYSPSCSLCVKQLNTRLQYSVCLDNDGLQWRMSREEQHETSSAG